MYTWSVAGRAGAVHTSGARTSGAELGILPSGHTKVKGRPLSLSSSHKCSCFSPRGEEKAAVNKAQSCRKEKYCSESTEPARTVRQDREVRQDEKVCVGAGGRHVFVLQFVVYF